MKAFRGRTRRELLACKTEDFFKIQSSPGCKNKISTLQTPSERAFSIRDLPYLKLSVSLLWLPLRQFFGP